MGGVLPWQLSSFNWDLHKRLQHSVQKPSSLYFLCASFFFDTNKSCNPFVTQAGRASRPAVSTATCTNKCCGVWWASMFGWCSVALGQRVVLDEYLADEGCRHSNFCLSCPFLQLITSWCSLAVWLRTCSPWTTTTQCVHCRPLPLPFPVLTASWLVSKGAWVSILSKETLCHMLPNSCWCRLWPVLKRSGKNAGVEDHSVAEEKVRGIF